MINVINFLLYPHITLGNCAAYPTAGVGNLVPNGGTSELVKLVAFEYEVDEAQVVVNAQSVDMGQGIYQVTVPPFSDPIRYDRMGSVYLRHASAPPLPHEGSHAVTPAGKPSNHAVIQYAAIDNQVPVQNITMIKMTEAMGSGTYHLNVKGKRVVYKKMGDTFMKGGSVIPGTNMVV